MKKKRIIILIIVAITFSVGLFFIFLPTFFKLFMLNNCVKSGIEYYSPAASSVSLCQYLTVGENEANKSQDDKSLFINKYKWDDAFYRYECCYTFSSQKETVCMVLTYSSGIYEMALNDIRSKSGFSDEIVFDYNDFHFYLNDTERQSTTSRKTEPMTNYCVSCDSPYIEWINLVGYSNKHCKIAFLGFYFAAFDDFFGRKTGNYEFKSWNDLMTNEFQYF